MLILPGRLQAAPQSMDKTADVIAPSRALIQEDIIMGHPVRVSTGCPGVQVQEVVDMLPPDKNKPFARLFVKHVASGARLAELRELFGKYGRVVEVRMLRGCRAIVEYSKAEEAIAATRMLHNKVRPNRFHNHNNKRAQVGRWLHCRLIRRLCVGACTSCLCRQQLRQTMCTMDAPASSRADQPSWVDLAAVDLTGMSAALGAVVREACSLEAD
eukprot:5356614-Pyramimonas_sp.AAC.4